MVKTMNNVSIFDLITRLNEIMKKLDLIELEDLKYNQQMKTEKDRLIVEYNEIIETLWGKIPTLKDDVNIQPKKREKKYGNKSYKI